MFSLLFWKLRIQVSGILGLSPNQFEYRLFLGKKWLYVHLSGQIFIISWTSQIYHLIIGAFIPITGRSEGSSNADVVIGIISCFFTLLMTSLLVTLKFQNPEDFRISLFNPIRIADAIGWSTQQTKKITRWTCIGLHSNTGHIRRDPIRFSIQWRSRKSNSTKAIHYSEQLNEPNIFFLNYPN